MEDNHNFRLNWLAYLVPASPELVTAQPQLVIVLIFFSEGRGLGGWIYVRGWHTFDFFSILEMIQFILELHVSNKTNI